MCLIDLKTLYEGLKPFAEEHPEAVNAFLEEYAASTEYVNANPAEAAEWIALRARIMGASRRSSAVSLRAVGRMSFIRRFSGLCSIGTSLGR